MSELTISQMIDQVPDGQMRVFEPSASNEADERYFQVWKNWDYAQDRLAWDNAPPLLVAPSIGSRRQSRTPLTALPPPEVRLMGPSKDVVDFYAPGGDVHFVSDKLFRLIDSIDPDSLEQVGFSVHTQDSDLPFHAVMPRRTLEAIDPRHTKVIITYDQFYAAMGTYLRMILFPEGVKFNNEALAGVASFSDLDAPGWYWSKDLLELAKANGIRGLYAKSVATSDYREAARL